MRRQCADGERAPAHLDEGKAFDLRHVDDVLRPRQAKLHCRDQGVTAGEELCLLLARQETGRLPDCRGTVIFECIHFNSPTPPCDCCWPVATPTTPQPGLP